MIDSEILAQLSQSFNSFHYTISSSGAELRMSCSWDNIPPQISQISVVITGSNPYSGQKYEEEISRFSLTHTSCHYVSKYSGRFELHFHAVSSSGERFDDFREPCLIALNTRVNRPPYIKYSVSTVEFGAWTKICVETNCAPRCSGSLWIKCDGRFQRFPELDVGNSNPSKTTVYLPINCSIELVSSDNDLPDIERIRL